jgi:hypothetical protein
MIAPLRSLRGDVTGTQKPVHGPAAPGPFSAGHDGLDPLQTELAPKLDDRRSTEEQHRLDAAHTPLPDDRYEDTTPAHAPVPTGSDTPLAPSTFEGPRGNCRHAFSGPFGFSEDALVRLEAGLRAQREELLAQPTQLTSDPGICPSDDNRAYLPRAAQLHPGPGLTLDDSEVRIQTRDAFNLQPIPRCPPVRLQPSPNKDRVRKLRHPLFVLSVTAIATLTVYPFSMDDTFLAPELPSIQSEVVEPAQISTPKQDLPSAAQESHQADTQLSNRSVPAQQIGSNIQPALLSPAASTHGAGPIQPRAQSAISERGELPSQTTLYSGGDTLPQSFHRGRKKSQAQRTR